jgi:uncharacterized protein (DUF2141 family)
VATAFGAKRAGHAGIPIALSAGQPSPPIRIKMPRGAVITGMVRDKDGAPLSGLTVVAVPPSAEGSARVPSLATAVSDDQGAYRLFGLVPGDYFVAAYFDVTGIGDTSVSIPSTEDIDARFAEMSRPPRAGLRAAPSPVRTPEPTYSPSPTFYPGTPMAENAERISLASGEERTADFAVSLVRTGAVEGQVRMSDGSPLSAVRAGLDRLGPSVPDAPGSNWFTVTLATGNPRFRFTGVTPGRYILSARGQSRSGGPLQWASTEVTTTGDDLAGLALDLRPAMHISGKAVFEGSVPPDPRQLSAIRLAATPTRAAFSSAAYPSNLRQSASPPAAIAANGAFDIADLIPGTYSLEARATGTWRLRSAVVGGRDVLDTMVEISAGDVRDVVLTFTERMSELDGVLTTPANAPATDYSILVFTTDQSLWRAGSRRVRSSRPAQTGRFLVSDLPGGEYFVAALTDLDPADLGDPAFLGSLVPGAVRVTLADGVRLTQSLKISKF